jgi:hypothetical protein
MSLLGSNPLWADLSQDLADIEAGNFSQAGTDIMNQVLGPSYDYTANIQSPSSLGVGSDGSLGQVITNAEAIGTYVADLTTTGPVGNQYFLNTGGMCTVSSAGDPNNGQTVPRATYVDNRMMGSDVLDGFPSLSNAIGGDLNTMNGIVPGMVGDLVALDPTKILYALMLPGTPSCQAYTCPTTDVNGNNPSTQTFYISPSLETNINKCTLATTASLSGTPSPETFNSYFEPTAQTSNYRYATTGEKVIYVGAILTLGAMLALKQ